MEMKATVTFIPYFKCSKGFGCYMYSTSSSPQLPPKQQTFMRQYIYRVLELVCSHISILIRSFGGAQPISEQDREIHNKERIEIELVHKMMPPA